MNLGSDETSSVSTATVQESAIPVPVRQDQQSAQDIPSTSTSSVLGRCGKQTKITGFASRPVPSSKRAKIDEHILRLVAKEYLPFNVVESVEFRKMTYLLNENYVPPSRKTLSHSLLSQVFDSTLVRVRSAVQAASYICITTDGWTSVKNENYIAVSAHFIDENCNLKSYLLSSFKFHDKHTAENISNELQNVTSTWGITNKIVACTTDNAPNMVKAVMMCKWWHVPCFAHTLNLIVQASLEPVTDTRAKVKSIVEFFKRSPRALEKLHNIQKQMGVPILTPKQDCPTRWNSTYEMFDRLLKIKEPLQSTLAILSVDLQTKLSNEDWLVIEKSCEILSPFEQVTTEISSERNVTLSKVVLLSKGLQSHCLRLKNSDYGNEATNTVIAKLEDGICTRLVQKLADKAIACEATLLDPRFREHGFPKTGHRLKETKDAIINKCCAIRQKPTRCSTENPPPAKPVEVSTFTSSSGNIWQDFDQAVGGLTQSVDNPRAASIVELDK
ncbi:zinc finger BED domain-containing protein 4-like [Schistocerca piceifrons]|uniref:zinc finger BED domain-containing protein 4-like n=1 Tax=Schistocerca piceifrons TaxID=274613 RepID=UPI001F5EB509|nr:zinc finger BED domain-containing protein 4-like [Schistocerca piceifrons]